MKKYFSFAFITVLVILLVKTNETELREAMNLPIAMGSTQLYSMNEFLDKFGWGISNLQIDDQSQTFSFLVNTGDKTSLHLNNQFMVEQISATDFSLNPKTMNYESDEGVTSILPGEQRYLTALVGKNRWKMGMYRAVLNMRDEERAYHWVVIFNVDRYSKIVKIQEKIFKGKEY